MVWEEIKVRHKAARIPLGGHVYEQPDKGIKWPDGRRIYGLTGDTKPEHFAGRSGENLLYLPDEASGISDAIHAVMATNPSGSIGMISNPTKSDGAFFRSHNEESEFWHCVHISSDEAAAANMWVPGFEGRRRKYPGIATQEWIDRERAREGEGSYFDFVRLKGEFPQVGTNEVITGVLWKLAEDRWRAANIYSCEGVMTAGVDPARYGEDEDVIHLVRGLTSLEEIVFRNADGAEIAARLDAALACHRRPEDGKITVRIDGNGVGATAVDHCSRIPGVEVVSLDSMSSPMETNEGSEDMKPERFDRLKDQLVWAVRDWLRRGGSVP